jgi:hypothetical protein
VHTAFVIAGAPQHLSDKPIGEVGAIDSVR